MVDENRFENEMNDAEDLERALASLTPRASRIDRDRLLFLSGEAAALTSVRRASIGRWAWPAATAISTTAAAILLAVLVMGPAVERHAEVERSSNVAQREQGGSFAPSEGAVTAESRQRNDASETAFRDRGGGALPLSLRLGGVFPVSAELRERSNYLRLRSFALAYGVNALPEPERHVADDLETNQGADTFRAPAASTQRSLLHQYLDADPSRGNREPSPAG